VAKLVRWRPLPARRSVLAMRPPFRATRQPLPAVKSLPTFASTKAAPLAVARRRQRNRSSCRPRLSIHRHRRYRGPLLLRRHPVQPHLRHRRRGRPPHHRRRDPPGRHRGRQHRPPSPNANRVNNAEFCRFPSPIEEKNQSALNSHPSVDWVGGLPDRSVFSCRQRKCQQQR